MAVLARSRALARDLLVALREVTVIRTLPTLLWLLTAAAYAGEPTVSELVEEALRGNPSLESLRAREQALRARAEVAGAWMDPMLSVEYSNVPVGSFALSGHPMAGVQLRVQQTLPPPAWTRLRREVGALRADAAGHRVAEAEVQLGAAIEKTWWLLARTRLLEEVTDTHIARIEELLEAVRARYETGGVGQHALLRLEVLRDRLTDDLGDFARADRELSAALSEALGRDEAGPWPTPTSVDPVAMPEDDPVALALAQRPLLRAIEAERESALSAARLARVDALPDVTLWAGYRVREPQMNGDPGTDLVAVGLGVPIPSGSARRAAGERAASLEEAAAAEATLESALDAIRADAEQVGAAWSRAWEKTAIYDETLIPAARSTLEITQIDFAVGRADFSSLFDAEVMLLDLERARIAAAVETHVQRAEAAAVTGAQPGGTE